MIFKQLLFLIIRLGWLDTFRYSRMLVTSLRVAMFRPYLTLVSNLKVSSSDYSRLILVSRGWHSEFLLLHLSLIVAGAQDERRVVIHFKDLGCIQYFFLLGHDKVWSYAPRHLTILSFRMHGDAARIVWVLHGRFGSYLLFPTACRTDVVSLPLMILLEQPVV